MLAGRTKPDARELLELVHGVNPTGRGLSADEQARLYITKSGLQSLLIRRFGAELRVATEPAQEGVVRLWHRYHGRDACHAIVSELDPDARAWVLRQLDEAGGEEHAPATTGKDVAPSGGGSGSAALHEEAVGPLEAGRAALEQYDFEGAQEQFRLAFQRAAGAPEAALALLDLLVDQLGLYESALEVAAELSPAAAVHLHVRARLALAAARLGRRGDAERLARGLLPEGAVPVLVSLAEWSLREQDLAAAGRDIAEIERCDPRPPELAGLRQRFAELRRLRVRPLAAELEHLIASGELEQAVARARDVLREDPESEVARRLLREEARRRDEQRAARLTQEAEDALARGDLEAARRSFQAASELGARMAELAERLERAEAVRRRRDEEAEAARIVEMLSRADRPSATAALLEYLSARESVRALANARSSSPALRWLDEMEAPASGARARAAAEAVVALSEALEGLERGDLATALALLESHERELRLVRDGARALDEARKRRRHDVEQRARAILEQAEAALQRGDAAEGKALLERCDVTSLAVTDRARFHGLAAERQRIGMVADMEAQHARAIDAGDWLAARLAAQRLVVEAAEPQRQSWRAEDERLRLQVREAWGVCALSGTGLDLRGILRFYPGAVAACLDSVGARAYVCTTRHDRLFVHVVDTGSGTVVEAVVLVTPQRMRGVVETTVSADSLWVLGGSGHVIELHIPAWDVMRWRRPDGIVGADEDVEGGIIVPETRSIWLSIRRSDEESRLCVVDLDRWRVERQLARKLFATPVRGGLEPVVVAMDLEEGAALYGARGSKRTDLPGRVTQAASHPGDDGLVLAVRLEAAADDEWEGLGLLAWHDHDTAPAKPDVRPIEHARADYRHGLVTSATSGIVFLSVHSTEGGTDLLAFAPSSTGLQMLYRVPGMDIEWFLQDAAGRHVSALVRDADDRLRVLPLGAEPPSWSARTPPYDGLSLLLPPFLCGDAAPRVPKAVMLATYGHLHSAGAEGLTLALEQYRSGESADDPETLLAVLGALERGNLAPDEAMAFSAWAVERHPTCAGLVSWHAELATRRRQWNEAWRALARFRQSGLMEADTAHLHHLEGMAAYHIGDVQAADRAWRAGIAAGEGQCPLRECLSLLDPGAEARASSTVILTRAVRACDDALARCDLDSARVAIDRPEVWFHEETQSLARLVEVFMMLPDADAGFVFQKTLALAAFVDRSERTFNSEVPLPGNAWDSQRISSLAARCREWLSHGADPAQMAPGAPRPTARRSAGTAAG